MQFAESKWGRRWLHIVTVRRGCGMVDCSCGDKGCKSHLSFESSSGNSVLVRLEQGDERWATMYLDANGIVELIHELKRILRELADKDER